jgi:hypothetical protein
MLNSAGLALENGLIDPLVAGIAADQAMSPEDPHHSTVQFAQVDGALST